MIKLYIDYTCIIYIYNLDFNKIYHMMYRRQDENNF